MVLSGKSFQRPGPAGGRAGRRPGLCVGQTLEAMSLEMEPPGGTGRELYFCSEERDSNPLLDPFVGESRSHVSP